MKLNSSDLLLLLKNAETTARLAGEIINDYTSKNFEILSKSGGSSEASQVLTEVDLKCQDLILKQLSSSIQEYDLAILSEELEDDKQRLQKKAFWCIDPLDGTLAFTQGHAGFAVSIALVSKQGVPLIGVVYDPVNDTIYSALKGQGAFKNNKAWHPLEEKLSSNLTIPCDRSLLKRKDYPALRKSLETWTLSQNLESLKEIHHAGAVMNALMALENPPALYFKPPKPELGGGSFWDFAATACIYQEAGAFVSDFQGKSLNLNSSDTTFMNQHGVIYSTEKALADFIQSLDNLVFTQ